MIKRTTSPQDLSRLKREREEADRAYNDALTRLDSAIGQLPDAPRHPSAPHEPDVDALERLAPPVLAAPVEGELRWRAWLRRLIFPIVRPALESQGRFNATVVEQLRHSAKMRRADRGHIDATTSLVRDHLAAVQSFRSLLVQYAQQITAYVDTKDREVTGLLRRANEDIAVMVSEDLRTQERILGLVQQRELTLSREFEGLIDQQKDRADGEGSRAVVHASVTAHAPTSGLEDYAYVGFERAFRGSENQIRGRLKAYVSCFVGASDVLDVGCGRGEFLDLLAQHGIKARGVDTNREMVQACRTRGLDVAEADAVSYLSQLPDGSLGGLFAAQVVEHLKPDYLARLLNLAYHKLRPGSKSVIETINVACWSAFFGPYLRDLSHERAIPSETLTFLLQASGFQHVEIKSSSPVDEATKLQRIPVRVAGPESRGTELTSLIAAFNDNVDQLNGLLFSHLDYTAVAERM